MKRRISNVLEPGETVLQALRRLKGNSDRKAKMSDETKVVFDQLTEDAMKLMENDRLMRLYVMRLVLIHCIFSCYAYIMLNFGSLTFFAYVYHEKREVTSAQRRGRSASAQRRLVQRAEDARPESGRSSRERRSLAQLAENARPDACRPEGTLVQRAGDAHPARRGGCAEDGRPASGCSSRERRSLAQLVENARTDACRPEGTLIQRAADARQARRGGSSTKWTLVQQVDARPASGRSSSKWTLVQRAEIARPAKKQIVIIMLMYAFVASYDNLLRPVY
ncbi:hypothetical protein LR48_Vigan10g042300 [Vigna angularis]|uniref:Uncharacterized protein n=1 Tax=Phaseolus angularis TaxID=3914 RepID=A0A0L9VHL0_PHAAN|nr:hypothetical protein LR48_Vigan10g042300 [Vigna angularis]